MSSSPKTIFVTGATGLVGGHAVEEALKRGHRVRALVRPTSDVRKLDEWGVEKVVGDLEDADALARGAAGADWIFNCAAKVGDWGTLAEFRRLNVDALRLLLDAAVAAKVERFVHVSSLGVYEGRDHHGTDETTPPPPTPSTPTPAPRPKPRPWPSGTARRRACRSSSSAPDSSTASATAPSSPSSSPTSGGGPSPTSARASRP
ncbi:3 beta-hydroxysteroid dehydrogenase/Delta 5--_4-isomerase [Planctomyces sp. SH-PL62]|nr:NAD(P)H-binding protein [Planctomyces sp. SH-PL62]AMV38502.1 3 beta-hydroxysteroid dehydrogenase/Delta 5-->4-isomerase [Planctomyces sp. SH-PL62]